MSGGTRQIRAGDLELRPATVDDARFVADLYTAVRPDDAEDPDTLAHNWRNPDTKIAIERFVGEAGGEPVAFAQQRHSRWEHTPERFGSVGADLLPAHRTAARLDALLAAMEERSRADGAERFTSWVWEDDALKLGVLEKRGYREERRERFWELDLVANRAQLARTAAATRERMREQGIEILTIDRDPDPDKWTKLWRVSNEAEQDVPTTVPHVESAFDDFMKWMRSPGLREDRIWIARQGDAILGVSMLSYPRLRGSVQTDWTGMARSARGKGIARALKYETVMQAIELGVDKVRTDNDSTNAPILHLNEQMGYR
ncbi:MAG TPA: GNAT family N-acetyltransferase, partial [Candidatus Limnocylindria bacterium]|nr:GNAT family N-acetyltransferase [Candidatus Limnocylindria bacterium]